MQILFDQNQHNSQNSSVAPLEAAPDSERSDAFSIPSNGIDLEDRKNRITHGRPGDKISDVDDLSGTGNSAVKALENLDINLQEINNLNNAAEAPSELLMSEIHINNQNSAKKEDGDLAEME